MMTAEDRIEAMAASAAPKIKNVRNFGLRRTVTFSVLDFSLTLLFSLEVERKEFADVRPNSGCTNCARAHSRPPGKCAVGECDKSACIHLDDVRGSSPGVPWALNELNSSKRWHANLNRITGRFALESLKEPPGRECEFGAFGGLSRAKRIPHTGQCRVALGVSNLWHRHATSFAHAAAPAQS